MHPKNNIESLLAENEKLSRENKLLSEQLIEARKSINAIKAGNIDALVIANDTNLAIFTEKTTDKIYRVLVNKMNEGAIILEVDGTILYCNSRFAGMVKQPLQKVFGKNFNNFLEISSKKRFEALFAKRGVNAFREQFFLKATGGQSMPVLISVNSFSLDDTKVLSIILTDLSVHFKDQEQLELKKSQLEQKNLELEIANKDLTSFTYISSHDLQEPLRKIQNFVTCIMLDEEEKLSSTGKGYFERLRQTARRMQMLIDDLLIYSRTKSSERKFEKTDLRTIVDEVKKDFEEIIATKKAMVDISSLGTASIIRFQFRQLINNLISNSLKFSKPGKAPHLKIESEIIKMRVAKIDKPETKYCHIIYSDNGIGFDPKYSVRIFEVFQGLHTQEKYNGTGIGLAICKRIVENHKGFITASGKPNMGVRFDIYIPE